MANTSISWGDQKWTMVLWPLPEMRAERYRLISHEMWHRIQDKIGLPASSPVNPHIDTKDGRIWLRLEIQALSRACLVKDKERDEAERDALTFRAVRRGLFPSAAKEEDALELNEGLAEFTGQMLRGTFEPESRLWFGAQLRDNPLMSLGSRSFAYRTGTGYAFLINLEEAIRFDKSTWRTGMKAGKSLSDSFARLIGFVPSGDIAQAEKRAASYGYTAIVAEENKRADDMKAKTDRLVAVLVDGPTLLLPLSKMNISFNPNSVFSLGKHGQVYTSAVISDDWGTITVTGDILVAPDFKSARVVAPKTVAELKGADWNLTLKPGWKIENSTNGSMVLRKE